MRSQRADVPIVQGAGANQAQATRYHRRAADPRRRTRRGFRPTPPARPKPRVLGGRRTRIELNVDELGSRRRADGPAVNPRGPHTDEKATVETPVAAAQRTVTAGPIEVHAALL